MDDLLTELHAISSPHRIATFGSGVLYVLGFSPMWLSARTRAGERDAARQSLRVAQIENALAAATTLARLGEYEQARVEASVFYSDLQAEVDRAASGFGMASRGALHEILAERDALITVLARGWGGRGTARDDVYRI